MTATSFLSFIHSVRRSHGGRNMPKRNPTHPRNALSARISVTSGCFGIGAKASTTGGCDQGRLRRDLLGFALFVPAFESCAAFYHRRSLESRALNSLYPTYVKARIFACMERLRFAQSDIINLSWAGQWSLRVLTKRDPWAYIRTGAI